MGNRRSISILIVIFCAVFLINQKIYGLSLSAKSVAANEIAAPSSDEDLPWVDDPASAAEKPLTLQDVWKGTTFKWEDLSANINPKDCYTSSKSFTSCFFAAEMLLNVLDNMQRGDRKTYVRFIPDSVVAIQNDTVVRQIDSFGTWKVLEVTEADTSKLTRVESLKLFREIRVKRKSALESEFNSTKENARIPFDKFLAWAKQTYFPKQDAWMQAAIGETLNAQIQTIDPHAAYMSAYELNSMENGDQKKFYGIGAVLSPTPDKKNIYIRAVFPNSPAEKNGLARNDVIVAVDHRKIEGISIDKVVAKIKGPENTEVQIHIMRGGTSLTKVIKRGPVEAKSALADLISDQQGRTIIRLWITQFTQGVCAEIQQSYSRAKDSAASQSKVVDSVIMDLRGNPGGLLDEAACVVGLFVANGVKVVDSVSVTSDLVQETVLADMEHDGVPASFHISEPLVILIDSNSASASEIVSGTIQYYASQKELEISEKHNSLADRAALLLGIQPKKEITKKPNPRFHKAVLVGTPSFGKGTMQFVLAHDFAAALYNESAGQTDSYSKLLKNLKEWNVSYKATRAYYTLPNHYFVEERRVISDIERFSKPNPNDDEKLLNGEEDMYENPLPPRGDPYTPSVEWTRFVSDIENCMKGQSPTAEEIYASDLKAGYSADYQLTSAQTAAVCLN